MRAMLVFLADCVSRDAAQVTKLFYGKVSYVMNFSAEDNCNTLKVMLSVAIRC